MAKRLTGLNPLAYLGVEANMPPNMFMSPTSPTSTDSKNFNIGDFWVNTTSETLYVLVSLADGVATWITTFGGTGTTNFVTDSGTATEVGGTIHVNGDGVNTITTGSGSTVHVDLSTNPTLSGLTISGFTDGVLVSNNSGVISEVTTTNNSLLIGNSSGTISSLGVATNGEIPIGSTGNPPVLATITAGTGVSVTNGAGSITIAATGGFGSPVTVPNGGTGDSSFTPYSVITGGTTSTGPLQNVVGVGTSGQVLTSNGAAMLPTWQAVPGSTGAETFHTDGSDATTSGNAITISGGNNITTSGAGSTVTVNVSGTTNHTLQVGNSTGSLTSLAAATNGQIPIGSTGANPVIATITAGSGISVTNGAGSITIAATGSGVIQSATITLTSAQVKSLQATPIQIVGAQGANTLISPVYVTSFLSYGGSNVFVAPITGSTIFMYYTSTNTNTTVTTFAVGSSSYVQSQSNYSTNVTTSNNGGVATASCINQPLYVAVDQSASGEITGNAANDNTLTIKIQYLVETVPL